MEVSSRSALIGTLERAGQELHAVVCLSAKEIEAAGRQFEDLAYDTDAILKLAAGVIGCVEDESVRSIQSKVQTLGAEARGFIQKRLRATSGILETVANETKLLGRLSQLTCAQRSIARETQVLSVLTNIEVATLGQLGSGFRYLAHELDEFSQLVARGTKELSCHTEERKTAVAETRRMLAAGLPRIQHEFGRIECDLETALAAVDKSHARLSRVPALFQECVERIAGQIRGVVAAVQSHDITRQQLEHVRDALQWIAENMDGAVEQECDSGKEMPRVCAGLDIQVYQLRSIRETVDSWLEQIGKCMDGILRISSSEVMGIGPLVFEQERELSTQLARIELIKKECEADNDEVQSTFAGLSNLMQLVGEHQKKSSYVRERMQLLTFNSMVEANHLGSEADTILEISQGVKRISTVWSGLTDRSEQAMGEVLRLLECAGDGMKAFSHEGDKALDCAQEATRAGLESLRGAAEFAAEKAAEIEAATGRLQAKIAAIGATRDRLKKSFDSIGTVLSEIEEARRRLEADFPKARDLWDREEAEAEFSARYTTEMEREVMRAALDGGPLPAMHQNLAGNSVELF